MTTIEAVATLMSTGNLTSGTLDAMLSAIVTEYTLLDNTKFALWAAMFVNQLVEPVTVLLMLPCILVGVAVLAAEMMTSARAIGKAEGEIEGMREGKRAAAIRYYKKAYIYNTECDELEELCDIRKEVQSTSQDEGRLRLRAFEETRSCSKLELKSTLRALMIALGPNGEWTCECDALYRKCKEVIRKPDDEMSLKPLPIANDIK